MASWLNVASCQEWDIMDALQETDFSPTGAFSLASIGDGLIKGGYCQIWIHKTIVVDKPHFFRKRRCMAAKKAGVARCLQCLNAGNKGHREFLILIKDLTSCDNSNLSYKC